MTPKREAAPPAARLTWRQVRAWRLAQHHLVKRAPATRLLDVVRDVCGLQAQVQSAAELQVWARVRGVDPDDVRGALWQERSLVRTWSMRGTLHLLTAEDLPLYIAALRTHDRWWKGAWLRMVGLSEPELRAVVEDIGRVLGARPLTREQLADRVGERAGPKVRERMLSGWAEMLKPAAFNGSLISGPPRGQAVTFVRPDKWLGGRWTEPPSAAAWREVVRRYLRAYGPASREEFGRWWGMQPAPAGRVLAASADDLAEVEVEGHRAWAVASDVAGMKIRAPALPVRLLPAFDVYVIGTRPRHALVAEPFEARVFRKAGWVTPVVLVDGVVAGVWSYEKSGGRIKVAVEAFDELAAAKRKAVAAEADSLGAFLGAPVDVTVSEASS